MAQNGAQFFHRVATDLDTGEIVDDTNDLKSKPDMQVTCRHRSSIMWYLRLQLQRFGC